MPSVDDRMSMPWSVRGWYSRISTNPRHPCLGPPIRNPGTRQVPVRPPATALRRAKFWLEVRVFVDCKRKDKHDTNSYHLASNRVNAEIQASFIYRNSHGHSGSVVQPRIPHSQFPGCREAAQVMASGHPTVRMPRPEVERGATLCQRGDQVPAGRNAIQRGHIGWLSACVRSDRRIPQR